ncbi:MAG: GGDEF domain-containing protein [Caldilineaceae bacterium]
MESSTVSPLLHLRSLDRKDFLPDILKIGILTLSLTSGLLLYIIWPIDNLEDMVMTLCALLPVLAMSSTHILQRRIYPKYNIFVSVFSILLLTITTSYAIPSASIPMMLAPISLVVGSLASFNRTQLRWLIGLAGTTMLIAIYWGARSHFVIPPGMPDNVWFFVGSVAIGVIAAFGMLMRYHTYMTRMIVELKVKNAELEQARDTLEDTVRKRTQDLLVTIDDLERSRNEIQTLAITDGLTGVFNRRHFMELAARATSPSTNDASDLSIILFDVDDFKQVNDTYGHQYGDLLLQEICNTIKEILRDGDIFARYGGEEFIILLPNTTQETACALAESIRSQVEQRSVVRDQQVLKATLSIGITTSVNGKHSLDKLLKLADQAQYRAKSNGKNCICSSKPA